MNAAAFVTFFWGGGLLTNDELSTGDIINGPLTIETEKLRCYFEMSG